MPGDEAGRGDGAGAGGSPARVVCIHQRLASVRHAAGEVEALIYVGLYLYLNLILQRIV